MWKSQIPKFFYVTEDDVVPIAQLYSDEYGICTIVDDQNLTPGLWNSARDTCRALNSGFTTICRKYGWPN